MPATPPRPFSRSTVASSISARQSHSTLPAGVRARIARWPMPNAGVASMVVSPAARRRNLLLCAFRSLSSVVQDWPDAGTNCRSSVQIRHTSGGASGGRILGAAGGADEGCHEERIHSLSLAGTRPCRCAPRTPPPTRWWSFKKANAPQLGTFRSSSDLLLIGPLRARSKPLEGTDQCPL